MAVLQSPALDEAVRLATAVQENICATYGIERGGAVYQNTFRYLLDPDLHDFRLNELPRLTADPEILNRSLAILDVGCGPGTLTFKACRLGHDAHGIDLDRDKIRLARAWVDAREYPASWRERVNAVDAGDLPYENGTFDLVTSYHVMEHVSDLRSVLYEAVRVTKRGGWIQLCAPDYRMSYDTHYCMPWPRFMPAKQAKRWTEAMGRPAAGIGTFFYVTAPEVLAILESLGCRIQTVLMNEHYRNAVKPSTGVIPADPIAYRSDLDVTALAQQLRALEAAGNLPPMYATCLEFTIAAQKR